MVTFQVRVHIFRPGNLNSNNSSTTQFASLVGFSNWTDVRAAGSGIIDLSDEKVFIGPRDVIGLQWQNGNPVTYETVTASCSLQNQVGNHN